jgi:hypothetical protein
MVAADVAAELLVGYFKQHSDQGRRQVCRSGPN